MPVMPQGDAQRQSWPDRPWNRRQLSQISVGQIVPWLKPSALPPEGNVRLTKFCTLDWVAMAQTARSSQTYGMSVPKRAATC